MYKKTKKTEWIFKVAGDKKLASSNVYDHITTMINTGQLSSLEAVYTEALESADTDIEEFKRKLDAFKYLLKKTPTL